MRAETVRNSLGMQLGMQREVGDPRVFRIVATSWV